MPRGDPTAAATVVLDAELVALYADLDAELSRHRPRCELSGRCCDFPTSGQRLYASDLESAHALRAAGGAVPPAPSSLCPWWVDGTCRLRAGRPLGCRVYFCDPAFQDVMPAIYERFHARIVTLHERHGVSYAYRPFIEAVRDPVLVAAAEPPLPAAPNARQPRPGEGP